MNAERVVIRRAKDGSFYFVHQAANGQVFSTSETYAHRWSAHCAAQVAHPYLPVVERIVPPEEA